MNENNIETQYDLTKKSKVRIFYDSNKIAIYSIVLALIIFTVSLIFYIDYKKKQSLLLSNKYIQAKIYIERENDKEALNLLKDLIASSNSTYSTLSLFLILDKNLITDHNELSDLFDYLLKNNKYEQEVKNLIIYKKALVDSNFLNEAELLASIRPLINSDSIWKVHALFLLGDYFISKNETQKAQEFYTKVLTIKDLQRNFYDQAKIKLSLINNVN
jgi:hypothetical protein